eukprot:3361059-Alexandrium_andersonii.AAC.1
MQACGNGMADPHSLLGVAGLLNRPNTQHRFRHSELELREPRAASKTVPGAPELPRSAFCAVCLLSPVAATGPPLAEKEPLLAQVFERQ